MNRKPILIFPSATTAGRTTFPPRNFQMHKASKDQQISNFNDTFTELDRVLQNESASIQSSSHGFIPEMILVMEIAGEVKDFYRAVEKTPGLQFLLEMKDEADFNEFFYPIDREGNRRESALPVRIFLTMSNQQALNELRRYWEEYKKEISTQNFSDGTTKFRYLFEQLLTLRPYSLEDRLRDTGFEDYLAELRTHSLDEVNFEIELAYKATNSANDQAYLQVVGLLQQHGGRPIERSRTTIDGVSYHAFIAKAPIGCFDELSENTNVDFLKCQQILFFRPVGQIVFANSSTESLDMPTQSRSEEPGTNNVPYVALLDGLPIENHSLLRHIVIDDPDGFSQGYQSNKRIHGTAMASIIINGDLSNNNEQTIKHRIYVRPILKPESNSLSQGEFLPDYVLPIDIVHRSVRRMFEEQDGVPPVAPTVKIINFSIGDSYRPFINNICTWARLIDWLSEKYNVMFIISAGNYPGDLMLDIPHNQFDTTSSSVLERTVIENIVNESIDRKILTPSESINSLTVGSSHFDHSTILSNQPQRKNIITNPNLLSPVSRIGFGYKKSIKPDILMPGGRKIFRKAPIQNQEGKTHLVIESIPVSPYPPGVLVATPGRKGSIDSVGYISGTSASAALASHCGQLIHEMLDELNESNVEKIPGEFFTVMLKALLVHSARWNQEHPILHSILTNRPGVANNTVKKNILSYIGYGCSDVTQVLNCTDYRVTLIGFGKVRKEKAQLFSFPLPQSLAQKAIHKRLSITLAWFTPINFKTFKYRKAQLYYDNLASNSTSNHDSIVYLERPFYDFDTGQKGTIQHDILEGDKADIFVIGDHIKIKVNCREDASGLSAFQDIRFAIAVTLEVKETDRIPIYEEIRQQVMPRVRAART